MKYTYLTLIIALFLFACNSKNNKSETVADSQFSSSKIINVLTDVQLMESIFSTHKNFRDKEKQSLLFKKVLDMHKITKHEFDSTLTYLENNLELYQLILDSVKIKIENMEKISFPFLEEKDSLEIFDKKKLNPANKSKKPIK